MLSRVFFFALILQVIPLKAQRVIPDTLNHRRLTIALSSVASFQAASTIGLSQVWYKNFEREPFHFFNDGAEWKQMDKIGHTYSAYLLSEMHEPLYRWTGLNRKNYRLLAGASSWTYLLTVELLDAQSSAWGFSWWDIAANTAGVGFYWLKDSPLGSRFDLKFSFTRSGYAPFRPSHLGSTLAEEILKDYNGQSYWLNYSLLQKTDLPWYLKMWQVSLGHSADAMLHAREKSYEASGLTFQAKRQWILSADIDWNAIPVRNKHLGKALRLLRFIKLPFPALIYSKGEINGRGLYF